MHQCQKPTNIKLKYDIDKINNLYCNCIDCGFKIIMTIDKEDLDYRLGELSIKEKLRYYLLKDFEKNF